MRQVSELPLGNRGFEPENRRTLHHRYPYGTTRTGQTATSLQISRLRHTDIAGLIQCSRHLNGRSYRDSDDRGPDGEMVLHVPVQDAPGCPVREIQGIEADYFRAALQENSAQASSALRVIHHRHPFVRRYGVPQFKVAGAHLRQICHQL